MSKLDYSKLDAAIVQAIGSGNLSFSELLRSPGVKTTAGALEVAYGNPRVKPSWRFVDARLQALRKKGAIRYAGQQLGWACVKEPGHA